MQDTKTDYQMRLQAFEKTRQLFKKQKQDFDEQKALQVKYQEQLSKLNESDEKLKSDMKFESENQVKSEKAVQELTKD